MIAPLSTVLLGLAGLAWALPTAEKRTVTALNQAAFEEAQKKDTTATRAFTSIPIKTSNGQCLFVDELSGDFRANLTPIQIKDCDGSAGQQWDIITKGVHNDQPGEMLVVSSLTNACLNFDDRRAAGNQVLLFACGGRADGSGQVQNAQLYAFNGGSGPLSLKPESNPGTCITIKNGLLDQAACSTADVNQSFTFGGAAAAPAVANSSTPVQVSSSALAAVASPIISAPAKAANVADTSASALPLCEAPVTKTVTSSSAPSLDPAKAVAPIAPSSSQAASQDPAATSAPVVATIAPSSSQAASQAPAATSAPAGAVLGANPTTPVPVSRAGGTLNPSSAAESNKRDDTATRAFTSVTLKSADGQCLFIDPTAGDFRQNLIPVALKACDGSANEKFDIITAGVHNNVANSALVVSSLTEGCLNFDPRRAAGDQVILFSCGGRADGEGQVTNSQLFTFQAGETSLRLEPENGNGSICLVPNNGKLDQAACSTGADQLFSIV